MKKISILVIVLLTAAMICSVCAAADTIKIGYVGSLTGDSAVFGAQEKGMLEMLIEETNANGGVLGKQIELIAYDSKGDPNEAVNATRRLVSQDRVSAIIGPNASGQCIAMAGVLEAAKVPDISTAATNPKVTMNFDESTGEYTTVKPYNFRVCFTDPYQGTIAAGFAIEELGFTKAAILYNVGDDYSCGLTEFFEKTFAEMGGTIVAKEAFKTDDVEFKAQLTNIAASDAEILFLPTYYKEAALIAKQARELGINAVLMGGDGWPSDQLFIMAKEALQGAYLINHLDTNDPEFAPLKEKFESRYSNITLDMNGYLAHDAYLTLISAIEQAGSADSQAITDALTQIEVQGITGTIALSPEDHNPAGKQGAIQMIEGDSYKFIMKYGVGR